VRDLDPSEVDGRLVSAPSALDIARGSIEKIAGARPGLFSELPDDLPWTDPVT
jgi:hypothetical protein